MTLESNTRDDDAAPVRDVRLNGGGLIIYDPDNENAWIQTDQPVPFG